ncbi:MAG: hypothetical protein AB7P14_29830, partial [Blastocatellales bacterium]
EFDVRWHCLTPSSWLERKACHSFSEPQRPQDIGGTTRVPKEPLWGHMDSGSKYVTGLLFRQQYHLMALRTLVIKVDKVLAVNKYK